MSKSQPLSLWFVTKMIWVAILLSVLFSYLTDRFLFGFDQQEHKCIPGYTFYIVDKHDREPVQRGETFAFLSARMEPLYPDGATMIKVVAGLPGDDICVTEKQVLVNSDPIPDIDSLPLARNMGLEPRDLARALKLEPNFYWMMGRTSDSFDSRYWGPMHQVQIVGRAYPIW
ncbi:hypothetical protein GCM10023116_15920 [Kistimonas scapharcae]|uniref:Peptidase S26 domain-containing protein n=1 Tax=Kistimonas scapharcae TaxID=1036133 RepID=A0ABP8UZG5_9GAMM